MSSRPKFQTTRSDDQSHTYDGPLKFRATCERCSQPRNRHCGSCKGCPGYHATACRYDPAQPTER